MVGQQELLSTDLNYYESLFSGQKPEVSANSVVSNIENAKGLFEYRHGIFPFADTALRDGAIISAAPHKSWADVISIYEMLKEYNDGKLCFVVAADEWSLNDPDQLAIMQYYNFIPVARTGKEVS